MSYIVLENIDKKYPNGHHAVKNVSLSCEQGEFVVLVGPSGCGKSTLLRMIAGLEDISGGSLFFAGTKVNELEPKERNIGMVFQNYALYPHMTIFENIAFPLKITKAPKNEIKKRVEEVAEMLDLTHYLERKPKELSGGQRQRVALGRALIKQPEIFLFDEPLSNLDAKLRVSMRAEITRLHRDARATSIYVTHDQTEAMTMADRIVVLRHGVMQQFATPLEIYNRPANLFVAEFMGSPQINTFRGIVKDGVFCEDNTNLQIKLNDSDIARLKHNNEVVLAVRSENIMIDNSGFEVEIDNIEYLGNESLVYFKPDDKIKSLRIQSNNNLQIKNKIKIAFNHNMLLFFDKQHGNLI